MQIGCIVKVTCKWCQYIAVVLQPCFRGRLGPSGPDDPCSGQKFSQRFGCFCFFFCFGGKPKGGVRGEKLGVLFVRKQRREGGFRGEEAGGGCLLGRWPDTFIRGRNSHQAIARGVSNAALANAALVLSSKIGKNIRDGGQHRKINPKSLGPAFLLWRRAGIDAALAKADYFSAAAPTIGNKIEQTIQNTKVASTKVAFDTV